MDNVGLPKLIIKYNPSNQWPLGRPQKNMESARIQMELIPRAVDDEKIICKYFIYLSFTFPFSYLAIILPGNFSPQIIPSLCLHHLSSIDQK